MKKLFVLGIGILISLQGIAQTNAEILPWSTPFTTVNATAFQEQIKTISKAASIVGLGEVSHYTKECYQLKETAIITLMHQGYDALVLEVDFGQALLWNDFVVHGKGDLDELVSTSGWFTYRTEEFKSLLKNIRNFNATSANKFQVFGMEMTAMHNNIDWLISYVSKTPEVSNALLPLLQKERQIVAFNQYSEEERTDYWNLYYLLKEFLEIHKTTLINANGEKDYKIAERITEITRQFATYISQDDFGLKAEFRDQFSARNIIWVNNLFPEDSKLVLWAHNGHVAKTSPLFNYDVLGSYLKRWYGDGYVAIGFTFNQGDFGAFANNSFQKITMAAVTENSITRTFSNTQAPFLFFNAREALKANNATTYFLLNPLKIRTDISESYSEAQQKMMSLTISETYDALIYIDKTSYPTTIPYSQKK
ncbi:erythromycin esterase family protein [Rasiella sp. SM2506]|uniref:erythromycin esterase family protein n=1 Tax=Rasiella sp. SM2506 TaxID=3423914 RepID=UPI003D7A6677